MILIREDLTRQPAVTNKVLLIFALSAGATLVGCATISKKDCLSGNWADHGFQDARNGSSSDRFGAYVDACAKVAVIPDRNEYMSGHERGVSLYCSPENGYRVGLRDGNYEGICPAALENAFVRRYVEGLEVKAAELENEAQNEYNRVPRYDRQTAKHLSDKERRRNVAQQSVAGSVRLHSERVREKIHRWRGTL